VDECSTRHKTYGRSARLSFVMCENQNMAGIIGPKDVGPGDVGQTKQPPNGYRVENPARSRIRVVTSFNWVKADRDGKLRGAGGKTKLSEEQTEISRPRSELARVTIERDILGKATAFFAKGDGCRRASRPLLHARQK